MEGKKLRKIIEDSGISKQSIADRIGKSRVMVLWYLDNDSKEGIEAIKRALRAIKKELGGI